MGIKTFLRLGQRRGADKLDTATKRIDSTTATTSPIVRTSSQKETEVVPQIVRGPRDPTLSTNTQDHNENDPAGANNAPVLDKGQAADLQPQAGSDEIVQGHSFVASGKNVVAGGPLDDPLVHHQQADSESSGATTDRTDSRTSDQPLSTQPTTATASIVKEEENAAQLPKEETPLRIFPVGPRVQGPSKHLETDVAQYTNISGTHAGSAQALRSTSHGRRHVRTSLDTNDSHPAGASGRIPNNQQTNVVDTPNDGLLPAPQQQVPLDDHPARLTGNVRTETPPLELRANTHTTIKVDDERRFREEIEPRLRTMVRHTIKPKSKPNRDPDNDRTEFGLCMVPDVARGHVRPTIVFTCNNRERKRQLKRAISKPGMRQFFHDCGFPATVRIDETLGYRGLNPFDYTDDEWQNPPAPGGYIPYIVQGLLTGEDRTLSGMKILTELSDQYSDLRAMSTLGGIIMVNEKFYGLTTAHAVLAKNIDPTSTLKEELSGSSHIYSETSSISEDDLKPLSDLYTPTLRELRNRRLAEQTSASAGIKQRRESAYKPSYDRADKREKDSGFDYMSDRHQPIPITLDSPVLSQSPSETELQNDPQSKSGRVGMKRRMSREDILMQPWRELGTAASFGLGMVTSGSYGIDWMLVEVEESLLRPNPENVTWPGQADTRINVSELLQRQDLRASGLEIRSVECLVLTPSGDRAGIIFPGLATLTISNITYNTFKVGIEQALAHGDSGAWVTHQGTLFGMVIAGADKPPTAYVLPIDEVFKSIGTAMQCSEVALPSALDNRIMTLRQRCRSQQHNGSNRLELVTSLTVLGAMRVVARASRGTVDLSSTLLPTAGTIHGIDQDVMTLLLLGQVCPISVQRRAQLQRVAHRHISSSSTIRLLLRYEAGEQTIVMILTLAHLLRSADKIFGEHSSLTAIARILIDLCEELGVASEIRPSAPQIEALVFEVLESYERHFNYEESAAEQSVERAHSAVDSLRHSRREGVIDRLKQNLGRIRRYLRGIRRRDLNDIESKRRKTNHPTVPRKRYRNHNLNGIMNTSIPRGGFEAGNVDSRQVKGSGAGSGMHDSGAQRHAPPEETDTNGKRSPIHHGSSPKISSSPFLKNEAGERDLQYVVESHVMRPSPPAVNSIHPPRNAGNKQDAIRSRVSVTEMLPKALSKVAKNGSRYGSSILVFEGRSASLMYQYLQFCGGVPFLSWSSETELEHTLPKQVVCPRVMLSLQDKTVSVHSEGAIVDGSDFQAQWKELIEARESVASRTAHQASEHVEPDDGSDERFSSKAAAGEPNPAREVESIHGRSSTETWPWPTTESSSLAGMSSQSRKGRA